MSATQSSSGAWATNFRSTRSGAGRTSAFFTVVRNRRRRVTPQSPSSRISRAIRFRPTFQPCSRNSK